MKTKCTAIAIFALAVCLTASADQFTFTGSGTGANGAVSASAVFTTNAGVLTIVLTNTLAASSLKSQGQALTDVTFTLNNAPGTLGAASATGNRFNVNASTGAETAVAGNPTR